tara:strand:+ start:39 stop:218 length:180 start_codon:yes stop_codon:yes gene_type:complete
MEPFVLAAEILLFALSLCFGYQGITGCQAFTNIPLTDEVPPWKEPSKKKRNIREIPHND